MHITDYIVLFFFTFFIFLGWRRGFLRSVLGPISLVIGTGLSIYYYINNENIVITLCIGIFGPLLINFVLTFIIKFWNKKVNDNNPPAFLSSLLGGSLNLLWSGTLLILIILLLSFIPGKFQWIKDIKKDITGSYTYNYSKKLLGDNFHSFSVDAKKISEAFQNPSKLKKLQNTKEFKTLMEDKKFQNFFEDEEIKSHLKNKEISKLLANPKMKAILEDKELLKKIFILNEKVLKDSENSEESEEGVSSPKVIEIKKIR